MKPDQAARRRGPLPTAAQLFTSLPRPLRRHRLMRAWMAMTRESPLQLVRLREGAYGYTDLSDGFQRLIVVEGGFDHHLLGMADRFLAEGGVFLDVGANHGLVSFGLAARHSGRVEFHLFEPNAHLHTAIAMSRQLYPDMRFHLAPFAVSDHDGTVSFTVVADQTGVSHIDPQGLNTVRAVKLDSYLDEAAIDDVTFMKVDIEGFELTALRGARASLEARRIKAVYFEYCERWLARDQGAAALLSYLEEVGYEACFCRPWDVKRAGGAPQPLRSGLAGHGTPLTPVAGHALPPETDLLAVPKEHLAPL